MLSPFQAAGIRLRLTALYADSADKSVMVRNLVYMDSRDLQFVRNADGSQSAKVDVIAAATGAGDVPLASVQQAYEFQVPPEGGHAPTKHHHRPGRVLPRSAGR